MRVVLGGTFSPLHRGHKALFQRAFELGRGSSIIVGLTSDMMAGEERTRAVQPFLERKLKLEEYLDSMLTKFPGTNIEIIQINEVYNVPITREIDADALVVSEGRKHVAEKTNELRERNGKPSLDIIVVPYVLAQDGLPIKSTRIADGELDDEGRLLGKVKIVVGTKNDVKLRAVKNILSKLYEQPDFVKAPVSSGVPEQPWGEETVTGALNRANNARKHVPDAHFTVGIEAGLFEDETTKKCFDVQYCVITDRGGHITIGHGPGFYYPEKVLAAVKGGRTVGEVMTDVSGVQKIGSKQGAIGFLTQGLLSREALTEQAVIMAMVPRITRLYE